LSPRTSRPNEERGLDPLGLGPPAGTPRRPVEAVVRTEHVVERLRVDVPPVHEDGGRPEHAVLRRVLVVGDLDDLDVGRHAGFVHNALDDDDGHVAVRAVLPRQDLDPHTLARLPSCHALPPSPG
jgi:hypothetical protein